MSVSAEDSQHMIDMLDVNHDNRISIDEFRRFVYLLPESLVSFLHSRVLSQDVLNWSYLFQDYSPVSG